MSAYVRLNKKKKKKRKKNTKKKKFPGALWQEARSAHAWKRQASWRQKAKKTKQKHPPPKKTQTKQTNKLSSVLLIPL